MPRAAAFQNNFSAGEVSKLISARTDFPKRKNACAVMENYLPTPQGPFTSRPGTRHVKHARYATTGFSYPVALVPFEFSTEQAYVLEIGSRGDTSGGYIRVYKDGGPVLESALSVEDVTLADPISLKITGHGLSDNDEVYISGVGGTTELNGKFFRVAVTDVDNFELWEAAASAAINGTGFGAYTSGGTVARVYEISAPYLGPALFDSDNYLLLRWAQSADVLYLAHPGYTPRKLSRTAHTAWTLTEIDFQDGPYLDIDISGTTLTPGAVTGSTTLTASANLWGAEDAGRQVRIKDSAGSWTWGTITGYTSALIVDFDIEGPDLADTTARDTWRLGLYISGGTAAQNNSPAAVTFFEDRLFWAGGALSPQRIDGSESSAYESMVPTEADGTVVDTNAVSFTLNANTVNAIRWLQDYESGLQIGTAGGAWVVSGADPNFPLTPTNAKARRAVAYGGAPVAPLRVGDATLFAHRAGRKLLELAYNLNTDNLQAPDLTILADHISRSGIRALTYHFEPWRTVWAVRADGVLLGMTYAREENVVGWSRHILGGRYSENLDGTYTNAAVESLAVIPTPEGTADQLWLQVRRTVNGANVRHIEILEAPWTEGDDQEDVYYMDALLTYDGAAATEISGLEHLEGETVSIVADGGVVPDDTVVGGAVTLDAAASVVQIGLAYTPAWESLSGDEGAADGTAQGKKRRINKLTVLLYQTLGLWVGPDADNMDLVEFRDGDDLMDTPPPIFDGEKKVAWPGGYESKAAVRIEQRLPFPMTVLGVAPRLVTQD